jgi:Co/Zn/Cd efflux system component
MSACGCGDEADRLERSTLWILLVINAVMFCGELIAGLLGESTGLLADSLDMFADAGVYAISLFAVGRSSRFRIRAARTSGWLQITLGVGVLVDVTRRFIAGSEPISLTMILVGATALVANVVCLLLLAKHRHGGVHMRASWIFSTNDVFANLGVIFSGVLVMTLGSPIPDLVIGTIVSLLVISGGRKILGEASREPET